MNVTEGAEPWMPKTQQDHIATPVPLPYSVRSNVVLKSMMCRELRDNRSTTSGIALLSDQSKHDVDEAETDPSISKAPSPSLPSVDKGTAGVQDGKKQHHFAYIPLPNPIEPLLLAMFAPDLAEAQDGTFIPPSAFCRCKSDSIRWSCQGEYTKNVTLNAWGY